MRPLLPIGIAGHDGSGKSLLAQMIREHVGKDECAILPLAQGLRREVNLANFADPWRKPTPEHLRALLRAWGWSRRVEEGEDYWLNIARADIRNLLSVGTLTVTDDVRHENEARWFANNGVLVAVHRPASDPIVTPDLPPIVREVDVAKRLAHISIRNDTTPEVLASWVPMIVREATGARTGELAA
jgi:hypothetical protein